MMCRSVVNTYILCIFLIPCLGEPMNARLVNGTIGAGRLEIYHNGEWGTVCHDEFGKKDATVACRMLGFNSTEAAAVGSVRYGQGSGPILLDDVGCSGEESSLAQCSHGGFYLHNCNHSEDVGVICINSEPIKARLVNGTMEAGRLEIYFNGEWGSVCHDEFGKEDATVACTMLGFNSNEAAAVGSVIYGQGSGLFLLDDVGCSGAETSLEQCSHNGFYLHNCNSEDVGVICNISESMKTRLVNGTMEAGRLEIYFNGEWGTVCDDEFGKEDATVACRMLGFNSTEAAAVGSVRYGQGSGPILLDDVRCNGTETSLEQCSNSIFYLHNCNHSEDVGVICKISEPMKARLVDGTIEAGRLEIYFNGEWGTVCDDEFGKEDATVACRMLGFNSTEAAAVSSVRYGQGSGPILMDNVRCNGTETSLEQCSHSGFYLHNCNHAEDVGVICNITEPIKARLVNGTIAAGRLEIYFNREWGTVCKDRFGKDEATVACVMLGFNSTEAAVVSSIPYGQGSGPILLDDVQCSGTETSLEQCSRRDFYLHDCNHLRDVSVICNITEPMKARLVNGTIAAGRLEIYFNGEWGTVCDDEFGEEEARVACMMLGFNSTEVAVISSVRYGEGSGRILLDDVQCNGMETSLAQCSHPGFYSHDCRHSKDVGLICNITKPMKARLADGTLQAGRLEIYFNGEWGTVCGDGFGKEDSLVACRMLGFIDTEAAAVSSVRYGQGSGPILLDDVRCSGAETSLEQCSHGGFYLHNCDHAEDVGVICNISEPMKARLVNGTTEAGRVEIYFNGEWGTVCHDEFGKEDATVACRMLGFNSTEAAVVSSVRYGQGSGPIILNHVRCQGRETSLAKCSHGGYYTNCSHSKDIGVICKITEPMRARLVNGSRTAGRLEIFYNGEWGTVCDDGFDKEEAQVACGMLGFNSTRAAAIPSARYGAGRGHILLKTKRCWGTKTSLTQCQDGPLYPRHCSHSQDVGVVCIIRTCSGSQKGGPVTQRFAPVTNTVKVDCSGFSSRLGHVESVYRADCLALI